MCVCACVCVCGLQKEYRRDLEREIVGKGMELSADVLEMRRAKRASEIQSQVTLCVCVCVCVNVFKLNLRIFYSWWLRLRIKTHRCF